MKGFSERNLALCRQFYQFYANHNLPQNPILQQLVAKLPVTTQNYVDGIQTATEEKPAQSNTADTIVQQLVAQIPWGHNILIFSKSKDTAEALFYIQKTLENGWSRNV